MKKALILHAWYNRPPDHWYPWLKTELEKKGYTVFIPELPTANTNLPSLIKMLAKIDETLVVDKDTVVIGHSLGTLLAMRLAEKKKYKKMILFAAWDFDDLTKEHRLFWPNKLNHKKIKENVKEIICFASDNDPYVTYWQVGEMCKRLSAKCILIKGAGHFTKDKDKIEKIPQVLKYL